MHWWNLCWLRPQPMGGPVSTTPALQGPRRRVSAVDQEGKIMHRWALHALAWPSREFLSEGAQCPLLPSTASLAPCTPRASFFRGSKSWPPVLRSKGQRAKATWHRQAGETQDTACGLFSPSPPLLCTFPSPLLPFDQRSI